MIKVLIRSALLICSTLGILPANTIILASASQATAGFVFANGSFTVTVSNATPTINAGNLLTGLLFSLNSPTSVKLTGQSGQLVNVSSKGVVSDVYGSPTWGFGTYQGGAYNGQYLLCIVCAGGVTAGGAQPSEGILGPGTGSNDKKPYSTANSSIKGNGPHNPFILESATFTFSAPGVTVDTLATSASFSFGTAYGKPLPGTPIGGGGGGGEVPEPGSMLLIGGGLITLGIGIRRRRSNP